MRVRISPVDEIEEFLGDERLAQNGVGAELARNGQEVGRRVTDSPAHREHFDLRPYGIIKMLDLMKPMYRQTASYGHFGRDDLDVSWEKTDKADTLRKAAKLGEAVAVA